MNTRFRPYHPEQSYLLPPSPSDWLAEGHLTYFIAEIVDTLEVDAKFWIWTVQPTGGDPLFQLQYVQRVILDFPPAPNGANIHWPHISVATLVKQ